MDKLIDLKNIKKFYKQDNQNIYVLNNINLEVSTGDIISIVGPSGSGKTTLLNIIGTLDNFTSGDYFFEKTNIINLSNNKKNFFRNKNIGFIHQFHYLINELSTLENVALPLLISGKSYKESIIHSESLLIKFGLKERINFKTKFLSGGEQQRVSIARSMINNPKLIIADEMTGNLDEKNSKEIFEFFINKIKNNKQTVIYVTHNIKFANMARVKYKLEKGSLNRYN